MRNKPLAELTLRKYEKPFRLEGRDLVKKLCLSLGLLQPGDSRDVITDVFFALVRSKAALSQQEIEHSVRKIRSEHSLEHSGCASSNIRRQIKRLKDISLIEKRDGKYNFSEGEPLHEVFASRIEKVYLPAIVERVKEYCVAVEKQRCLYGEEVSEMRKSDE
ncbi:hypothetical protein J4219_07580 [Candidatus Woesearchaeota archaeon]|nr:hypothetical protein [Candidatus Woesearchaeota archaeon]